MQSKKLQVEEQRPLRERIADSIRASIIDGRIKPGERLTEPEVSKMLGVSRTPLREAFFQLIAEGFVEAAPRRGVVVSDLSVRDAQETYVLKGALEALAARLAVAHDSPGLVGSLEELNRALTRLASADPPDVARVLALNNEFHQTLTDASDNRKLSRLVAVFRRQTLRYNYIYLSTMSRLKRSVEEHGSIITAVRNRNGDEVEQLVRKHNDAALNALREFMESATPGHGATRSRS